MFQDVLSIHANDFYQLVETANKVNIIDVREDDEVATGMIPTAHHIRLRDIPSKLSLLDQGETYYIICHSGVRSVSACDFLQEQGFKAVNVEGGMREWLGAIE